MQNLFGLHAQVSCVICVSSSFIARSYIVFKHSVAQEHRRGFPVCCLIRFQFLLGFTACLGVMPGILLSNQRAVIARANCQAALVHEKGQETIKEWQGRSIPENGTTSHRNAVDNTQHHGKLPANFAYFSRRWFEPKQRQTVCCARRNGAQGYGGAQLELLGFASSSSLDVIHRDFAFCRLQAAATISTRTLAGSRYLLGRFDSVMVTVYADSNYHWLPISKAIFFRVLHAVAVNLSGHEKHGFALSKYSRA